MVHFTSAETMSKEESNKTDSIALIIMVFCFPFFQVARPVLLFSGIPH